MVRREIAHGNGGRSHRLRKHCRWRFLAFFESRCFLKVRPLVAGGVFMRWVLVSMSARWRPSVASFQHGASRLVSLSVQRKAEMLTSEGLEKARSVLTSLRSRRAH